MDGVAEEELPNDGMGGGGALDIRGATPSGVNYRSEWQGVSGGRKCGQGRKSSPSRAVDDLDGSGTYGEMGPGKKLANDDLTHVDSNTAPHLVFLSKGIE